MTSHDKPDTTDGRTSPGQTPPGQTSEEDAQNPGHDPQAANDPDPAQPEANAADAAAAYARAQGKPEAPTGAEPVSEVEAMPTASPELDALKAENADLRNQMLRTMADMENLRRRTAREKEDSAKYAISKFAKDLLSVADNLQRALQAIPADATAGNELMQTLADGVAAVDRELAAVLERNGVKPVDAAGKPFDSNIHEAVMEQPTADVPPGHVAQVFQTGYLLNDRLLRPAMVAVAKALPGQAAGDETG